MRQLFSCSLPLSTKRSQRGLDAVDEGTSFHYLRVLRSILVGSFFTRFSFYDDFSIGIITQVHVL